MCTHSQCPTHAAQFEIPIQQGIVTVFQTHNQSQMHVTFCIIVENDFDISLLPSCHAQIAIFFILCPTC